MEPRKVELTKTPEQRRELAKSRFQIVKLEERIAPNKGGIPNGGHHKPPCYYLCCRGKHCY